MLEWPRQATYCCLWDFDHLADGAKQIPRLPPEIALAPDVPRYALSRPALGEVEVWDIDPHRWVRTLPGLMYAKEHRSLRLGPKGYVVVELHDRSDTDSGHRDQVMVGTEDGRWLARLEVPDGLRLFWSGSSLSARRLAALAWDEHRKIWLLVYDLPPPDEQTAAHP